jgi:shikimate dehydrogenase
VGDSAATRVPIGGGTKLAGVIGSPVRHSRSPAILNAAFAAAALDWAFVAFEVLPGSGPGAVSAMRTLGLGGLSVTMPHKHDVLAALDHLTDEARALDAVNCIAWDGDALVGHNTDGSGLVDSLAIDHEIEVRGRRCVVVGAGGAGRSVVRALAAAGAVDVAVINRTPERAASAALLAGPVGRVGTVDDVAVASLVVNATSVGMGAPTGGATPIPAGLIAAGHVVVDLVYQPLRTPLLEAAEAAGATPVDGLGMLVHQAALAFTLWTGQAPDLAAMRAAAAPSPSEASPRA